MSNHSRASIRLRRLRQAQADCRHDLNQCAARCDKLTSSFNKNLNALTNMNSEIDKLRSMSTGLGKIPDLMGNLYQTALQLEEQMNIAQQNGMELDRTGNQIIQKAQNTTECMEKQFDDAENVLQTLRQKMSTGFKETVALGRRLEKYFEESERIMDEIDTQKKTNEEIENQLGLSLDQIDDIKSGLNKLNAEWMELNSQIMDEYNQIDQNVLELGLLISSIGGSSEASYAIVKNMCDENFKLASYQKSEAGIEAFIKDQDDRLIAVQLQSDTKMAETVLLDLNLSEFDPVKKYKNCNKKLNEILEKLTDIGTIIKRKTQTPHKKRKGGSKLKERPFGRRDKNINKQSRLKI